MSSIRTCTQDYTHVSGSTGTDIDGCVLSVYRTRWTTDEALARRHLFTSVRYRDAETGEFVLSDDLSQPEGSVAEYGFMVPMSDNGRRFASTDEAWDFALERGYLQRFFRSRRFKDEDRREADRILAALEARLTS